MKYYIDITLLPDAEANLGFIWQKVYQQIHLMLVENKVEEADSAVAVSFPQYKVEFPLGNKLRLLAETEHLLQALDVGRWLSRLDDYTHIKAIKAVPMDVTDWVYFKRWDYKSPNKLRSQVDAKANYLAQKNGFVVEDVKERLLISIAAMETESKLPFINMTSLSGKVDSPLSTRANFKLFIEKQPAKTHGDKKKLFTCYGLSRRSEAQQVAVPWFD